MGEDSLSTEVMLSYGYLIVWGHVSHVVRGWMATLARRGQNPSCMCEVRKTCHMQTRRECAWPKKTDETVLWGLVLDPPQMRAKGGFGCPPRFEGTSRIPTEVAF